MPVGPLDFHFTQRPINVHWGGFTGSAGISLSFDFRPTGSYGTLCDGATAILSTLGLPPIEPTTIFCNSLIGQEFPPLWPCDIQRGIQGVFVDIIETGENDAMHGEWGFYRPDNYSGGISWSSTRIGSGEWHPFMGSNELMLSVSVNLPPLDFGHGGPADNHYEWTASASFDPGTGETLTSGLSDFRFGTIGSSGTLIFAVHATIHPLSFEFTAG